MEMSDIRTGMKVRLLKNQILLNSPVNITITTQAVGVVKYKYIGCCTVEFDINGIVFSNGPIDAKSIEPVV